jgi:hypothetical protein
MLLIIHPYRLRDSWVFDDARTGLQEEAFVMGMSEMITRLVESKRIANAERGFALTFAAEPFECADVELSWLRCGDPEVAPGRDGTAASFFGNWYAGIVAGARMEGWLCPALSLYFHAAPKCIYLKAEPLPAGFDPIWHVDRNAPNALRFVSAPGAP